MTDQEKQELMNEFAQSNGCPLSATHPLLAFTEGAKAMINWLGGRVEISDPNSNSKAVADRLIKEVVEEG